MDYQPCFEDAGEVMTGFLRGATSAHHPPSEVGFILTSNSIAYGEISLNFTNKKTCAYAICVKIYSGDGRMVIQLQELFGGNQIWLKLLAILFFFGMKV
jgi:hypothetical protein